MYLSDELLEVMYNFNMKSLLLSLYGTGGEWTACDVVQLGVDLYRGSYQWEENPNFNINERSTINITVNLAIRIHGICINVQTYHC